MKIYVNRNMTGLDGQKLKELNKDAKAADTANERLGVILIEGLLRDLPGDESAGAGMKMNRWKTANRIQQAMNEHKEEDYTIDMHTQDVNMVKLRLGRFLPTVLLGPTFMAIDPDGENGEEPRLSAVQG